MRRKKLKSVKKLLKSPQSDPNGSYTGIVAENELDTPVQDADDL